MLVGRGVWTLLLVCGLAACVKPTFTHCPDLDCPTAELCDNHGGCALPEQLSQCAGQPDGTSCSYTDIQKHHIDGACAGALCIPLGCGDGILTPNEVCDDGNNTSGDGCSADCQSHEACGNSLVDTAKGEQCDDGNTVDGDGCQANCLLPRCGDGVKDVGLDEACDSGSANANTPDAPCRPNCQLPRCGDGIRDVQAGEACDDGNNASADGCSGDCKSNETCGNNIVDALAGEVCDDGNTTSGDGCSANCKSIETCGNHVVDVGLGEVCDDGNTVSGDGCSSDCRSIEVCGNGIVDTIDEQCDRGTNNTNAPDSACRTTCMLPFCGDMIIDPMHGEQCDDGMMNANLADACRTNCERPRCGDGIQDSTEVCDDGNTTSGDNCSSDCHSLEVCGNGIIDTAKGEQCDAGLMNANTANATCRTDCSRQRCGDSIVDTAFGESCDMGAANSNLPNAMCRANCVPQRCGDGVVDNMLGEVCDDSNVVSGDGCSADCKSKELCGNGIVDIAKGEQCDDGNAINNDQCHNNCTLPKCGDGIVDFNEQCDAGAANSNLPNAPCRSTCVPPRCGDLIVDTARGEACDDGNNVSGDGCSGDCSSNETCGNGVVDAINGEQCDDGNGRGRDGCSKCLPENAVVYTPGGTPLARESEMMIYDSARQRVVMFGGWTPNGNLGDTWEWDGVSWTQMHPKHSPSPRFDVAAGYDAVRHRIVLFGGYKVNYGDPGQDTWEYDGVDWTMKAPATLPAGRAGAAATFDANRGHVIMFGGAGAALGGTPLADTWDWNGTNWTQLMPATSPTARGGGRMVFDSTNNYVLLFGGATDTHTWTFDGATWTDRGVTAGPTTGYDTNAIAFDANLGKVVMWAASTTASNTYEWSGAAWTAIAGTSPTFPRTYPMMAYDAIRKQLVLFGGATTFAFSPAAVLGDTWVRTSQTWSQPAAFTEPSARTRSAVGYDPLRKKVVLFGGQNAGQLSSCGAGCMLADTWEWNGRQWQQIAAGSPPAARAGQVLAYSSTANAMLLYGGDSSSGGVDTAFTDVYSYSSGAWAPLPSSGRTAVRDSAMAYDANANKLVTFGGTLVSNGAATSQTWTWASGWSQANPASSPPARSDTSIAYDPIRHRTVLFGGNPGTGQALADVWEWDGANWSGISATNGPSQRFGHRLFYNPDSSHVDVFGNSGGTTSEDLFEWSGAAWVQRQLTGNVAPKYQTAVAYDAANHAIVAFSGDNPTTLTPTGGTVLLQYQANGPVESCTSAQIDYDNDGKLGCADDECWSVCTPLCPPGVTCPANTPKCGDGSCGLFEDCNICPTDCGACAGKCGDFHCDGGETHASCPNDC